jgi:hypothetical protein
MEVSEENFSSDDVGEKPRKKRGPKNGSGGRPAPKLSPSIGSAVDETVLFTAVRRQEYYAPFSVLRFSDLVSS